MNDDRNKFCRALEEKTQPDFSLRQKVIFIIIRLKGAEKPGWKIV